MEKSHSKRTLLLLRLAFIDMLLGTTEILNCIILDLNVLCRLTWTQMSGVLQVPAEVCHGAFPSLK